MVRTSNLPFPTIVALVANYIVGYFVGVAVSKLG
jgi:hypothetical protein